MGKIKWTEKAIKNLEDLHNYIANDSVLYAQRFITSLIHSTEILEKQPLSGRIVPEFEITISGNLYFVTAG